MTALRKVLFILTLLLVLFVWVHPFREVGNVRSGDEGHLRTKALGIGESITQFFTADDNNIIQLEFVLDYDDTSGREGQMLFELVDFDGEVIFQEELDYAGMEDYSYCGPAVNVPVRKGRQYAYRLTNLSIRDNQPCGIYTTEKEMCCLKGGAVETDGKRIDGELLTRVTSNRPLTAANTLSLSGCIGMAGFGLCTVLERGAGRRQKNGIKE